MSEAMARMCERCADRPAAVTVGDWDVCDRCAPREQAKEKPVKPVLSIDGPMVPLDPTSMFLCEHYNFCSLMARACVERQTAKRERQANASDKTPRSVFEYCASGECRQGALIKLRTEAWNGRPAETRTFRHELKSAYPTPRPTEKNPPKSVSAEQRRAEIADAVEQRQEERAAAKPPLPQPPAPSPEKKEEPMPARSKLDVETVRAAFLKAEGNISGAAKDLGVAWGTARKLVEKFDLHAESAKAPAPKPESKPRAVAKPRMTDEQVRAQTEQLSAAASAERVHYQELPDPALLPPSYLLRCVQHAARVQRDLAAALAGDDKPLRAVNE